MDTRIAFINGALNKISSIQSGLHHAHERLERTSARANEMVSHLDALSADAYSSQLTTIAKKVQKTLDILTSAIEIVETIVEDVSKSVPQEDESEDQSINDEDDEIVVEDTEEK